MYALLVAIFVSFVVLASALVGMFAYDRALTASWMKSEKLFGFLCAAATAAVLIEYGWPAYSALVIEVLV